MYKFSRPRWLNVVVQDGRKRFFGTIFDLSDRDRLITTTDLGGYKEFRPRWESFRRLEFIYTEPPAS